MATLTGEKLEAALSYNKDRGLDPETIERVQKVVGAEVDGKLGRNTAKAVFQWQGTVGLTQDGKIGPKTLAAIMSASASTGTSASEPEVSAGLRLGLWVDDVPSTVLSKTYFDNLEALGFSTLAIMVHGTTAAGDPTWRPRWNSEQLAELRALAEPRKMSLVITTWPVPDSQLLAAFAQELPPLLSAARPVALEIDTEGNWLSKRLHGYANMKEAALELVATLRTIASETGAKLELTTYPYHAENSSKAQIAPYMDRLFPQAYSVGSRTNMPSVEWGGPLGPGQLQHLSAERARTVKPVVLDQPKLAMGLAAYDQKFAGHDQKDALTLALQTAIDLGVAEVRYWSSKWVVGENRAKSPVAKFFLDRANGSVARAGAPHRIHEPDSDFTEAARTFGPIDAFLTSELEDLRAAVPFEEELEIG
jgi:hypothetical protein